MLQAEGDSYYRYAQNQTEYQMADANTQAAENEPQYIHNNVQATARFACIYYFAAKGPER
jgi:hypothetical protein